MHRSGYRGPGRPDRPSVPSRPSGRLAQLVERLPYKQEVTGSSPVPPTGEAPASTRLLVLGDRLLVCWMTGMEASWKRLRAQRAWPRAARSAPGESAFGSPHELGLVSSRKEKLFSERSLSACPCGTTGVGQSSPAASTWSARPNICCASCRTSCANTCPTPRRSGRVWRRSRAATAGAAMTRRPACACGCSTTTVRRSKRSIARSARCSRNSMRSRARAARRLASSAA